MPTVIHELADAFLRRKQALAERGQAKTKLAGSDYFMPKSAKEDLNNRLSVFEQGGLPELLKQAGKEMYDNPIVNTAIGLTPVVGDIQAAGETVAALQRGAPWQETAGYAAGMLPFIPALGGMVKNVPEGAWNPGWYHGTTKDFPNFKGVTFVTQDPKVASKFAADDMLYSPESTYITEGANIRPLQVNVKNTFDYDNKKHINTVAKILDTRDRKVFKNAAEVGDWTTIENFLDSIREAGFDSFNVKEFGSKNMGIFDPTNSVKSAFEK